MSQLHWNNASSGENLPAPLQSRAGSCFAFAPLQVERQSWQPDPSLNSVLARPTYSKLKVLDL